MSRDHDRRRSRSRSPRRSGSDFGRPRRDNKLAYLSNLPYEMRWMELKSLIREKAGEVNFVEMVEERNGRSKGCAVVEFTTVEGAKEGIEKLNGLESHGRRMVAKDIRDPDAFFRRIKDDTGVDFTSRSGANGIGRNSRRRSESPRGGSGDEELYGLSPSFLRQHNITPPLCQRVFIANLAYNVTSGIVWEMFSMAGKVVFVDLQTDKEGKSKGNAVVEFSHPLEAVQAISMFNNQKFYDRGLVVKMDRFEKKKPLGIGELPRGLSGVGMGLGANGAPLTDIASIVSNMHTTHDEKPAPFDGPNPFGPPSSQYKSQPDVYGGARPTSDPFTQRQFESSLPPPHIDSTPFNQYGGPPRVDSSRDSFGGRPQQSQFTTQPRDNYAPPTVPYGASRDGPIGGPFGGHREFNGSGTVPMKKEDYSPAYSGAFTDGRVGGGASTFSSRIILIKNLPPDYTWQIVRDRAMNFGEVEQCELVQPGVARIRFSANSEAERARGALAGTSVEGRPIAVDFVM